MQPVHVLRALALRELALGPRQREVELAVELCLGDAHGSEFAALVRSPSSRQEVDAFHRAGLEAGGRDNGAPGVREQYSSDEAGVHYAAFVLDPDGNNVEAVRREF